MDIVRYLVEGQHCDPKCVCNGKNTALHLACRRGHMDIVRYLVEGQHCDPKCVDRENCTPLHLACWCGHMDIVRYMVEGQHCDPKCVCNGKNTALHLACRRGHMDIVRYLVEGQHCDPKCVDHENCTPLHLACWCGHMDIVRYMVEGQHCDPKCVNNNKSTPLHLAYEHGHTNIVRYLVEGQHCDPKWIVVLNQFPLHMACEHGHMDIVQYLLENQHCNPKRVDNRNCTPLHVACEHGHMDIVQYLVEGQHCDPKCVDHENCTPLHLACWCGHMDIVRYLVEGQHCDPKCVCNGKNTALHLACRRGHMDIVRYLVEGQHCDPKCVDRENCTPLHLACWCGHMDIVRYMVEGQHCDPKYVCNGKNTALHLACRRGHMDIVRYLVEGQHCDPKCVDHENCTPLHLACWCGHMDIVRYMVEGQHCDPKCVNNNKSTPLHLAYEHGHTNIVRYLVEGQHCDPKWIVVLNQFPLHMACEHGHMDIVQYLLENQHCNPKRVDNRNCTPLHVACEHGHMDIVQYLVEGQHCDPKCVDHENCTPLHVACKHGHTDIVQYLVEGQHCDPKCVDHENCTPLHLACWCGHMDIVRYLVEDQHCDPKCVNENGQTPLQLACESGHVNVIQYLVEDHHCDPKCVTVDGQTLLHLACKHGNKDVAKYLLALGEVISVNSTNLKGESPLALATTFEIIQVLVQHGADFSHIFSKHKYMEATAVPGNVDFNLPSYVKLYIIGNPLSGKTTLAKAIRDEHTKDSVENVEEINSRTAGIILSEFESAEMGHVAIYDFAGQPEYYVSHSAILQNSLSSTAAIFLALVDLRESDQDIEHYLHYWLSYIENHCISVVSHPHLVVIGSHLDECPNAQMKIATLESTLASSPVISSVHYAGLVPLDCRKPGSDSMAQLRQKLKTSCSILRVASIESLYYKVISLSLLDLFGGKLSLQLATLIAIAQKTKFSSLRSPLKLFQICEQLNDRGHILFLPNEDKIEESWIVINKQALLSEINGTLFAPPDFKEHRGISSATGVVPVSRLTSLFSQFDPDLIIQCLVHLEFCQLIRDEEILKILMSQNDIDTSPTTHENYLFFPSLVSIQKPPFAWAAEEEFEFHCGWYLHCKSPHQFLTSRFLQVLLLRLIFSFAVASPPELDEETSPVSHRECSVWKNGIRWQDLNGIEVIVEVVGQQKGVLVMMRCLVGTELDCVKLRSAIIRKVLVTKKELCEKVMTTESLIHPSELRQYPTKDIRMLKQCSFSVVTRAISEGKPCVYDQSKTTLIKLDDLLYFEPYAHLGKILLSELFLTSLRNRDIPEHTLFNIAKKACNKANKLDAFSTMFDVSPDSYCGQRPGPVQVCLYIFKEGLELCKDQSYEEFRHKLDEYSIFCGRNPLVRHCIQCEKFLCIHSFQISL